MGDTRARILSVARGLFARQGLDRVTLRRIAREAEVDPALLLHYFASKEDLFFESVRESVSRQIDSVLHRRRTFEGTGEHLVDAFLTLWDSPEHRDSLVAFVRAGISNDRIGARLREFLHAEVPSKLAARVPRGTAEFRAALVASQLVGLALVRYVVRLRSIAGADRSDLTAMVGPTLERYLSGPILA
jgi:AcrR family transcriptional regulator